MRIDERAFSVAEAKAADEAFVTASSLFVMPVVRIDNHAIGMASLAPMRWLCVILCTKEYQVGAISALLNRFLPWIILLSIGVGWGLSFSLAKIAVNAGGSALGVAFWQSLVSGIFLLVYSLSRYGSLGIERHHIRLIVTVTLTGALVPGVIFYMALVRVSPGVLAITDALVPIITYAFTVSLGLERPSLKRFIGVLAGMVGIIILVVPENAIPDRSMIPWILLSCLGAGFTRWKT